MSKQMLEMSKFMDNKVTTYHVTILQGKFPFTLCYLNTRHNYSPHQLVPVSTLSMLFIVVIFVPHLLFEWYMGTCESKNKHQIYMCWKELRLCTQLFITILVAIINMIDQISIIGNEGDSQNYVKSGCESDLDVVIISH